MFVDLVGSTALAGRLDPEELNEVMKAYQSCCARIVQRCGGTVARYLGDGAMAYFGYPYAHETDAEQAIRAGLEIVTVVAELAPLGHELRTRVGIATGLVVADEIIGDGIAQEHSISGETPNLAQRLESLARPNSVVVSETTKRLAGGLFDYVDIGPQELKGFSELVPAWVVTGTSAIVSRFEAKRTSMELTPLVGRDEQMAVLQHRWHEATGGAGQVVVLSGEPGIGKSRMIEALREQLESEPHRVVRFYGSPNHQHTAFHPIVEQLLRLAGISWQDPPETKIDKLLQLVEVEQGLSRDSLPLIAHLLSLPMEHRFPNLDTLHLGAERMRQKTLEMLESFLFSQSRDQPLLLVFEDLHWVDPSTLELLERLVAGISDRPALLLLSYRPDFVASWSHLHFVTTLTLNRLSPSKSREVLGKLTQGKDIPDDIRAQIVDKCDGIPLFLEELFKAVTEARLLREHDGHYTRGKPQNALSVPSTLQDSLMARLDRLGEIKEIAQIGAVIGRQFPFDLLAAVSPLALDELERALDQLCDAELIFRRDRSPDSVFTFKHALVQEAAYSSLLNRKRRQLHAQLATVMEDLYPERVESQPEVLAHHLTRARLLERAVDYWTRAGERAIERSANAEAIAHLSRGMELLDALPASPVRDGQELKLRLALGLPLMMTKGHNAREVEDTYSRARDLSEKQGAGPELFSALVGLWRFCLSQARFRDGLALGQQAFDIAERLGDPEKSQEARLILGSSHFYLAELEEAHAQLQPAIAYYDRTGAPRAVAGRASDPRVMCLSWESWTLWELGYPDQALSCSERALVIAGELGHPYSLSFALFFAAVLHHRRREIDLARQRAREAMDQARKEGFVRWLAGGQVLEGWARAKDGDHQAGLEAVHSGLTAWRKYAGLGQPHMQSLLAEVYLEMNRPEEALRTLGDCIALVEQSGERRYEPEFHRLSGEVLRHLPLGEGETPEVRAERVETCLSTALGVARQQRAKWLELRAASSLAGWWLSQGRAEAARALLEETIAWFTEGLESQDYQEAMGLLRAAGAGSGDA